MFFEDKNMPFNEDMSYIVYDGDCPFCSAYVKLVRLREAIGKVQPVNARESHPIVSFLASRGVVLDQEMALVSRGRVYSGPDCINQLALLSTRSSLFNKANAALFSSPWFARLAYPLMRCARNMTLRLMGRKSLPI
jgi:predicted DCC family thiol-disulfide oxidoreductase YuxK